MDSNKRGFLVAEILNPLSRSWKKECVVHSTTDGVIILTQVKGCQCDNSYKSQLWFQREGYVDVLWMEVYRNWLTQFRVGVSQINLHRHRFPTTTNNTTCPFCANQQETEIRFVFQCPVYPQLRSKYLPDIINVRDPRKHLIILMNSSCQETILNVAKFLVCTFKILI